MVGSSLIKHFKSKTSYTVISTNRDELDLMEKQSVDSYFKNNSIDYMIIAAAKVGGYLQTIHIQRILYITTLLYKIT